MLYALRPMLYTTLICLLLKAQTPSTKYTIVRITSEAISGIVFAVGSPNNNTLFKALIECVGDNIPAIVKSKLPIVNKVPPLTGIAAPVKNMKINIGKVAIMATSLIERQNAAKRRLKDMIERLVRNAMRIRNHIVPGMILYPSPIAVNNASNMEMAATIICTSDIPVKNSRADRCDSLSLFNV